MYIITREQVFINLDPETQQRRLKDTKISWFLGCFFSLRF